MNSKPIKPAVVIIINQEQLNIYLDENEIQETGKNYYLDFSESGYVDEDLLQEKGFKKITPKIEGLLDRDIFLKKYIDLVAKISRNNNSRIWWASELASKNRFTSNLPVLLQQYTYCVDTMEKVAYDRLLIINPNSNLIIPLQNIVKKSKQKFVSLKHLSLFIYRINKLINFIRYILSTCYQIIHLARKISFVKKELGTEILMTPGREKSNYLIKSFIYDHSFSNDGEYSDVFFGRLPEYLSKEGNVIILSHIIGAFQKNIQKIKSNSQYTIIPNEYFLTNKDLVISLVEVIRKRIKIPHVSFFGYDVTEVIKRELNRTGVYIYHYVIYYCMKNLAKTISIDRFFLTYENIAWENMCILALRKFSPNTKIIGYQHTVIPQAAAGMFISKGEIELKPMPDKVLTVGEITKKTIQKCGEYPDGMVDSACALRYEYLFKLNTKKRTRLGSILLALEAIPHMSKMVNYCLEELWNNLDYKLIIRPHPACPWEYLKKAIHYDIEKSSNVSISKNTTVLEDLQKVDIVIYWGSTVALEAISMGIPIIHYDMQSVLSYDPMFECNDFKWIVTENDSLLDKIEYIYSLNDNEYYNRAQKAKNYINRYFHPVTEENLKKFIFN